MNQLCTFVQPQENPKIEDLHPKIPINEEVQGFRRRENARTDDNRDKKN